MTPATAILFVCAAGVSVLAAVFAWAAGFSMGGGDDELSAILLAWGVLCLVQLWTLFGLAVFA
ncbi:MAG: hypothetical protein WBF53_13945 [Litorimonas sp.]